MTKKILIGHPHYCPILNHKTVSGSQFYAEYIYNAFALYRGRIQPDMAMLK
ncbi:hypothetical protein [Treponema sp.]|uniref:hypothetical protein n=1 Tax=Treponema sp. TaxID=166 RepID=UPI00257F14D1|nr:hypothetical protein [Treponema sp.]